MTPADEPDRTWHVYLIEVDDVPHPKFFVCLARFGHQWYGCLINSSLSLYDAHNPDVMAAVMELEERDYSFLSHDSYFCADEHFHVPDNVLAANTQLGVIAARHRHAIYAAVRASKTMKLKAQKLMVAALSPRLPP